MNLATMQGLVSSRLNEAQSGPTFYPTAEITAALNEGLRFFCLLTLGLEVTAPWVVPAYAPNAPNTFTRMLPIFADWICVLRITTLAGKKIRPTRMEELSALDAQWVTSPGTVSRYVSSGCDLVGLYNQPAVITTLNVTYAQAPATLALATDTPAIGAEYHPKLVDYGIYRMRQVEGAQEFEKALPYFDSFMAGATQYAAYVRPRNRGSQYDKTPFELEKFDRSQLLKLRKDLMPERKVKDS